MAHGLRVQVWIRVIWLVTTNIQIPVMVLHTPVKISAAKDGLEPSKRLLKVRLIRPLLR